MKQVLSVTQTTVAVAVFALCCSTGISQEGYFTTYGHEVEKGELEFMLMIDHTAPSKVKRDEGQHNFLSQMPEIGYCPTDQLSIELMVESFQEFGTGIAKFTGFRFETRYRLFKKEVFFNPTIYFEFEDLDAETRFKMETSGWIIAPYKEEPEGEPKREKILESRLILSQNIGNWNVAFNWLNETDTRTGATPFGYALGAMYKLTPHYEHEVSVYSCPMHSDEVSDKPGECSKCGMKLTGKGSKKNVVASTLTFELLGGLGDDQQMGIIPWRQEHYFQPGIMLHLPNGLMLSTAFAIGLTDASDDLVRIMLMKMF
ncbi:MAG: hypothetical protein HY841_02355 [Bacteroidetes bacterium]|nr:hypothetical protein [Bacteroidota bacterium]